jgi:hypothetical protein
MSLTIWLIAKLSRVEAGFARRALVTARAQDELDAPVPTDFARGAGAMAYGLALVISRRPVQFYGGLSGLIAFFVYMAVQFLTGVVTLGMHYYGR